ncbi:MULTISPECIES: hypothetical protein [Nocardia]|uniref:hypothetical protein n=1 Tax=Nocardia TaxID=1817 RepID=UPI000FDBCD99|nr:MULTISPECIES: hypothetical protein [Nocardia]
MTDTASVVPLGDRTIGDLIAESGLRRDVVYQHSGAVRRFQQQVAEQVSTADATRAVIERRRSLQVENDCLAAELEDERTVRHRLETIMSSFTEELGQLRRALLAIQELARG